MLEVVDRAEPQGDRVTVVHTFHALAFIENFSLKELALHFPEAKRLHQQLSYPAAAGGTVFLFSFGVVIFFDVGQAGRKGSCCACGARRA